MVRCHRLVCGVVRPRTTGETVMPDLENRGVAKDYQDCSNACIFYFPAGFHAGDCTPLKPRTEAEREATRQQYKGERVKASLRQSQKDYLARNTLQRKEQKW